MARSPDEIDFEQYYEDWRHRDTLTWQIPAVTVAIGSGIIIGSYIAEIPWYVRALAFGLGAFFIATLTVMLAQNLYYQWRDEKHLEDYGNKENDKPQSRPIPRKVDEEDEKGRCWNKLGRILDCRRMGSTLLLVTCFLFYVGLSYLFVYTLTKHLERYYIPLYHVGLSYLFVYTLTGCYWLYLALGTSVLVIIFLFTFGWFLCFRPEQN